MAAFLEISIRDGVTSKLKTLENMGFVNAALMAGAVALKRRVAVYPPSRSRPGRYSLRTRRPMGWYKRGTGWMEPLVQNGRAVGYRNRRATSETFGRKWTIAQRGNMEVALGNNTSYGPWAKSRVKVGGTGPQSRLLRAYGWKTIEQDVEQAQRSIVARVESELAKKFGG